MSRETLIYSSRLSGLCGVQLPGVRVMIFMAVAALAFPGGAAWASELSDPTRPTPLHGERRAAPQQPTWTLNSTLVSEDRRVAIINGRAVGVGDQINGARVVRVEQGAVWLEYQGNRFSRTLPSTTDVKSPGSQRGGS